MMFKKTRIAPTPSGFLHLGNVFSFALTAALAKKAGAGLLLRIDDLDRDRIHAPYIQDIFETLHFMEIPWNEGPKTTDDYQADYSQLRRLPIYNTALLQLRDQGLIYACTCSRAQVLRDSKDGAYPGTCRHKNISPDAENACWRLNTADAKSITLKTWTGITESVLPHDMQDFIVRKKDGLPAYQLASVVDDVHFGVDLIVRGLDLWPSTLAQLYLASVLKMEPFANTTFLHHPLIQTPGGTKLSKSAGDTSIHALRRQGKSAAEIYTLIGNELKQPLRSWEDLGNLSFL